MLSGLQWAGRQPNHAGVTNLLVCKGCVKLACHHQDAAQRCGIGPFEAFSAFATGDCHLERADGLEYLSSSAIYPRAMMPPKQTLP
jgi:hypothetical protein